MDKGEEFVVGDVQRGKLGRFPLHFLLFPGVLLVLV